MSYPAIWLATATVGRHRCPQKRLQTAPQPPVYPNSSPDHRACNSLAPFRCPHAVHPCPSVDSGLVKRLRGKKPNVGPQEPDGVVFEAENIRIVVPTEVARLYRDKPIRDQLEAFVRPLAKAGVEKIVFRQNQTELESVRREEVEYFKAEPESADKTEYIIPGQHLQITSLVFGQKGKWRLSDGANVHWYAMEDKDFAIAIQQGKRFGKNDILVCEVLMTQWLDEARKLRLEYSVMRVLRHITPGEQMPFPSTDPN